MLLAGCSGAVLDHVSTPPRLVALMIKSTAAQSDLTAFAEAVKLESEGFAFARYVQYAILFDRLFRFPITGSRVRNYDGLGGQLLFAFLHQEATCTGPTTT